MNIRTYFRKGASLVLTIYILVISVVFPLYVTESGYERIGHDKYFFFRVATYCACGLSILALALGGEWKERLRSWRSERSLRSARSLRSFRLSAIDWATIVFVLSILVSFAFSDYRSGAIRGSDGWFIGLETLGLIVVVFWLISRCLDYRDGIWLGFMLGAGGAFLIGIMNRFSYYPLDFPATAPHFITTIGNINWVAGYFSVLWPIGAKLYIFSEKKWLRVIAAFYTFIAICLGLVLGADSAILSFVAVGAALLMLCMGQWEKWGKAYLETLMLWCLSCFAVFLARIAWPDAFNYDDALGLALTDSAISMAWLLALLPLYLWTRRGSPKLIAIANHRYTKLAVIALPLVIAACFLLARLGGQDSAIDVATHEEAGFVALFDSDLGNGRGAIWNITLTLLSRMSPAQWLIGVGPDCFSDFLYSFPDLAAICERHFGAEILRNAHSELLTMLVNLGLLGLGSFLGIFATAFIALRQAGKRQPVAYIPIACMGSYLLHNTVSFSQVLNLSYVFIIMAIGISLTYSEVSYEKTKRIRQEKTRQVSGGRSRA